MKLKTFCIHDVLEIRKFNINRVKAKKKTMSKLIVSKLDGHSGRGDSVVQPHVAEEVRHGLVVVDAPYGLTQQHTDVHSFDLVTMHLFHLVRDSVSHHHLGSRGTLQVLV